MKTFIQFFIFSSLFLVSFSVYAHEPCDPALYAEYSAHMSACTGQGGTYQSCDSYFHSFNGGAGCGGDDCTPTTPSVNCPSGSPAPNGDLMQCPDIPNCQEQQLPQYTTPSVCTPSTDTGGTENCGTVNGQTVCIPSTDTGSGSGTGTGTGTGDCTKTDCTGNAKESTLNKLVDGIKDIFHNDLSNIFDYKTESKDDNKNDDIKNKFKSEIDGVNEQVPTEIDNVKNTVSQAFGFAKGTCYPMELKFTIMGVTKSFTLDEFCKMYDKYIKPIIIFYFGLITLLSIFEYWVEISEKASLLK